MIKLVQLSVNNFKQLREVVLRFPPSGSVIIEGRNEAGKSTLFEAIFFGLFGRPLLAGTSTQDLIAYDANDGVVELTIAVPDGQFVIQRKVRRTKVGATADARLRIVKADGEQGEEIKGANAVNLRIQQELKLDADAFLNSCFVEQKKLEKLEGMTRKDRETSLMRLLNLDRLLDEEKSMAVTLEDNRRLQRLKQRVDLAEVMERIPVVQKRGRELTAALNVIALKEGLASLAENEAAIGEAEARVEALREPIAALEDRVRRIDALKAASSEVDVAVARFGKCEQGAQQVAGLEEQLADLERVECEELPALRARRRKVAVLRGRWARLIRLDEVADDVKVDASGYRRRFQSWDAARAAIADAGERLAALEEPVEELEARLGRIETLRAAAAEAEMAGVRLAQVEGHEHAIASDEAELTALYDLENEGLPALHAARRRALVLRSQWVRIRQLQNEVDRLKSEAADVRQRLVRLDAARRDLAALEERVRTETARAAELKAEEGCLARAEYALSLRQALEDWLAADHARRSLSDLERQIAAAETDVAAVQSEAEETRRHVAELKKQAGTRMVAGGGLLLATVLTVILYFALGIGWIWMLALLFGGPGIYALGTAQRMRASAAEASRRHEELKAKVLESRSKLLHLEGQYENAQASQSAAGGRLEAAVLRLEALDEGVPTGAPDATRRLAELPESALGESPENLRDRLAAVRAERAGLRAGLEEQEKTLAQRRRDAGVDNEALLHAAADRLDARAARITETILDRWTEAATARAATLDVVVTPDTDANREAAGHVLARIEADTRLAGQRLAGRAAIEKRIAARRETIAAERERVRESCATLISVRGVEALPATREDAASLKADVEGEIATLEEDAARSELGRFRTERNRIESERATAERDARGFLSELAIRFRRSTDEATDSLRDHFGLEIDALDARAARIEEVVARWAKVAAARVAALGLTPADDMEAGRDAAARAESVVDTQIRAAEERLEGRPALQRRIAELEAGLAAERRQIVASLPSLPAVRPDAPPPVSREEAETLRADLRAEVDGLNEDAARADLREKHEARHQAINDRTYHERTADQTRAALRERADKLKVPADVPLVEETLAAVIHDWESVAPEQRPELEEEWDRLREENGYLLGRRADLARTLGLDTESEKLNLEKEKAAHEALARDIRVREHAATILKLARDRIVDKVLPYTIEHMRRILPALTTARYHDAKLTEDYKIEVWDERAAMWKAKNIFSGGTRDQFSLALRLAFAMATLPQERGAAPGFIFLDEPLSSFDIERADALMYLLTRGEVAETFDQIFVISHSQAMGATEFGHRLRLDNGRIAEASDDLMPSATGLFDGEA